MKLIRYRSFRRHKPEKCMWCAELACKFCGARPPISRLPGDRMVHVWAEACPDCAVKIAYGAPIFGPPQPRQ